MSQQKQRQWFAVYSKARKERFAEVQLRLKGLDTFFPRLCLPQPRSNQPKIVSLFPNYLFVKLDLWKEYEYVIWSPGVKRFVAFNGTPAPIDDEVIKFFMEQADADGVIRARSNLRAGEEVRISGGPFNGLAGLIQKPPDAKGRVKVLMKLLSREVGVEVPARFVRSGWVISGPPAAQAGPTL